jgi:DNA ligase (NAD+)
VAYYLRDAPIVDDATYDAWHARLDALRQAPPDLLGPRNRKVGGGVDNAFAPVLHAVSILSLDNAYGPEDVAAWAARLGEALSVAPEEIPLYADPKARWPLLKPPLRGQPPDPRGHARPRAGTARRART